MFSPAFSRLSHALSRYVLNDGKGGLRTASPDEFMLMAVREGSCGENETDFKHRDSRNYLTLRWNTYADHGTEKIVVFVGGPFHGGTFPAPVAVSL